MADGASHRFKNLIQAATRVFIRHGYHQTQMADIAKELGVAKGTLYLYVESKEALFDLACRWADAEDPPPPASFPIPTPAAGATLSFIKTQLAKTPVIALADSLVHQKPVVEARQGLKTFVETLYDDLARNRRSLKLLGQSARDLPELASVWYGKTRTVVVGLLADFLTARMAEGTLVPVPDAGAAARTIVETAVFWAVHRHWDPLPQSIDESTAKATVVFFALNALSGSPEARPRP